MSKASRNPFRVVNQFQSFALLVDRLLTNARKIASPEDGKATNPSSFRVRSIRRDQRYIYHLFVFIVVGYVVSLPTTINYLIRFVKK